MQYIKVTFPVNSEEMSDMLTAMLADVGYNGFEDVGDTLLAYIDDDKFNESELDRIAALAGVSYATELLPMQNWNALWESNFPPVIVDDFCTVYAHFHEMEITTPYRILITPKMSFGTGHHATTQLMMLAMKDLDFAGKSVIDFGTGTGVLAILAEKLGAANVLAIDNDLWCVENAGENVVNNGCSVIQVKQGSLEEVGTITVDIILANINRHILLQYMQLLYEKLNPGGIILMSGLLAEDESIVKDAATATGFVFDVIQERNNWIILKFIKIIN
jgi:ribosomal protein L11 methyltransferase